MLCTTLSLRIPIHMLYTRIAKATSQHTKQVVGMFLVFGCPESEPTWINFSILAIPSFKKWLPVIVLKNFCTVFIGKVLHNYLGENGKKMFCVQWKFCFLNCPKISGNITCGREVDIHGISIYLKGRHKCKCYNLNRQENLLSPLYRYRFPVELLNVLSREK